MSHLGRRAGSVVAAVMLVTAALGSASAHDPPEATPTGTAAMPARAEPATRTTATVYAAADVTVSYCNLDPSCETSNIQVDTGVGCNFTAGIPFNALHCFAAALEFDVPSDLYGGTVHSATLRLYPAEIALQPVTVYEAYGIQYSWNPATVTWSTFPNWYTFPYDWVPASGLVYGLPADWDVTDIVANWASGTWVNNGFVLWDPNFSDPGYTTWRATRFHSLERYDSASERPQLVVDYDPGVVWTCNGQTANIVGDDGANTLTGGPGVDVIVGLGGNDVIDGGGGDDVICGGDGNDRLVGGPGNDFLHGEGGKDTVDYSGAPGSVTVNLKNHAASGAAGTDQVWYVEHIIGSAYGDTLTGDPRNNRILAGGGKDVIAGLGGADKLFGGGGIDTAVYTRAAAGVTVDLGAGTASGGHGNDTLKGIENVNGSVHRDFLTGDAAGNRLFGGAGNDRLSGLAGRDVLLGGPGAGDHAIGGGGWDKCKAETTTGCEWP
jgi:hypothetical protein